MFTFKGRLDSHKPKKRKQKPWCQELVALGLVQPGSLDELSTQLSCCSCAPGHLPQISKHRNWFGLTTHVIIRYEGGVRSGVHK